MRVSVSYTNYPGISSAQNFSILVTSSCLTDTLTLDTTKFASPAFTYNVNNAAADFIWTDASVSSDNNLTTCGTFTWTVTKTDGFTAIDSEVFKAGDFNLATKTINVYTADFSKADTYYMQVKVFYTKLPTIFKT
jgi:hypothetical protein